jgi:hypothetical protein
VGTAKGYLVIAIKDWDGATFESSHATLEEAIASINVGPWVHGSPEAAERSGWPGVSHRILDCSTLKYVWGVFYVWDHSGAPVVLRAVEMTPDDASD